MASSNGDNALEKGTTFTFQSWTYIADGSGGFTNHLDDHESMESNFIDQFPPNNSAAPAANTENPPKDSRDEPEAESSPQATLE